MVVDTSAIIASITDEPDSALYRNAIKGANGRLICAVTLLETQIVLFARFGPMAVAALGELIDQAAITVVPFDKKLAQAAFDAFRKYGKGQGHPAQLNIIDCAAYALAKEQGLPLLFKGDDFSRTDVVSALSG